MQQLNRPAMSITRLYRACAPIASITEISGEAPNYFVKFDRSVPDEKRKLVNIVIENWRDRPDPSWEGFFAALEEEKTIWDTVMDSAHGAAISGQAARLRSTNYILDEDPFVDFWNKGKLPIDSDMRKRLRVLIDEHDIPFELYADGKIEMNWNLGSAYSEQFAAPF